MTLTMKNDISAERRASLKHGRRRTAGTMNVMVSSAYTLTMILWSPPCGGETIPLKGDISAAIASSRACRR